MTFRVQLTLVTAVVLSSAVVFGPAADSVAQTTEDRSTSEPYIMLALKTFTSRATVRAVSPRSVAPRIAPRVVTPRVVPRVAPRVVTPRVSPGGVGARSLGIRGANRARIGGRTYSIWRGNHRVYSGGRWRTFVGLSALSVILVGDGYYYPYAYIDAPVSLCRGLTEDGCQLHWVEVQTLDGSADFQCVAFCPRE